MKIHLVLGLVVVLTLATCRASPSKSPEVSTTATENKSPITGSPSPAAKKPEVTEGSSPIALEEAEEPKQADRTKKSASTTFCVEIRPGPSEAPVKVCEDQPPPPTPMPQLPQVPHEVHEQPPPPPPHPTYVQEPELPVCVVPEFFVPNDPCLPQQPFLHFHQFFHRHPPTPLQSQVIIPPFGSIPYPPIPRPLEPCPPTDATGNPHALLSLLRSATTSTDGALPSLDGSEPRSGASVASAFETGAAISSGIEDTGANLRSEHSETPFARTFLRRLYGLPVPSYYPGSLLHRGYPHLFRYNSHLFPFGNGRLAYALTAGRGRSADETLPGLDENGQDVTSVDGQTTMDMSQQARHHIIHPFIQPYSSVGEYPSHSTVPSGFHHPNYEAYHGPIVPYSTNHHSVLPGYSFHPQQQSIVLPSISVHSHPGIISTGLGHHLYRSDQRHQQKSDQQGIQEKSWSATTNERDSTDRKSVSETSIPMSPSRMLDRMRGSGGSSGFNVRPIMQTFPRTDEERSSNENAVSVRMNFPPGGGQPFMLSGPRSGVDEKRIAKLGDCDSTHDESGKREAEKSASVSED